MILIPVPTVVRHVTPVLNFLAIYRKINSALTLFKSWLLAILVPSSSPNLTMLTLRPLSGWSRLVEFGQFAPGSVVQSPDPDLVMLMLWIPLRSSCSRLPRSPTCNTPYQHDCLTMSAPIRLTLYISYHIIHVIFRTQF